MVGAVLAFVWLSWRFYGAENGRSALEVGLVLGLSIFTFFLAGLGFSASLY